MSNSSWRRFNVSQGVLVLDNKVLLVANDYGAEGLVWSLPGGRLEEGEQHETALIREFKEETGLEVVSNGLIYVTDSKSDSSREHFVVCIFAVSFAPHVKIESNGEPTLSCETDLAVKQVRFVPFTEIPRFAARPSLGEPLINYLYYGNAQMPRRYWCYPNYKPENYVPTSWPPS